MTTPKRNEAVALPVYVATAPERIYLQISDDEYSADKPFPRDPDENVTWCVDSVVDLEVKYVRADIHDALQGEVSRLRGVLAGIRDPIAAAPEHAFGVHYEGPEQPSWPIRDEMLSSIDKALNLEPPTNGR